MPPISLKALIVSNVCYWLFVVLGMIVLMVVYYAGITVASDGTANSHAIFEQMRASSAMMTFIAFTVIVAASLAGYIGARIASDAKILNGGLAVSLWLVLEAYTAMKGGGSGKVHGEVSFVLSFLSSYGAVIPALAGAYLGNLGSRDSVLRAQIEAAAQTEMPQPHEAARAPAKGLVSTQAKRRLGYGGSGFGVFIVIASELLLSKQEQNVLFVCMVAALVLMVAAAFVIKKLKATRG